MPQQTKEEQLREEWYKEVSENSNIGLYRRDIADWWLQKFSSYKSELKERVESMKRKYPPVDTTSYINDVDEAYNKAIKDIINLIETE